MALNGAKMCCFGNLSRGRALFVLECVFINLLYTHLNVYLHVFQPFSLWAQSPLYSCPKGFETDKKQPSLTSRLSQAPQGIIFKNIYNKYYSPGKIYKSLEAQPGPARPIIGVSCGDLGWF